MMDAALNYWVVRERARKRLPRGLFEYIDRGTEDEVALKTDRSGWQEVKLHPNVLVDVETRSLETELFGERVAMPVVVAPTALAGLVWHDGERALARAAAACGIPFTVATQSISDIEHIATSRARLWFQLYVWRDRELMFRLIERARAAAATALVLTVDTAVAPKREYNIHNGFGMPLTPGVRNVADVLLHPRWLVSVMLRQVASEGVPTYRHYPEPMRPILGRPAADAVRLDERVCWRDLGALRRRWPGPLVVKGVLRVDDALRAVEAGVDGIVVSTHGGRNLDSAPAVASVLGQIADAVGHKATVLADSGIRRGSDVVKALALGAKAVLVGRMPLYGTAAGGEAGARDVLAMLREEIERTMGFCGRTSIGEITRDLVEPQATGGAAAE